VWKKVGGRRKKWGQKEITILLEEIAVSEQNEKLPNLNH